MMRRLLYIIFSALPAIAAVSCGGDGTTLTAEEKAAILSNETPYNPYLQCFDSMPPNGRKLRISPEIYSLRRQFNDSNHLQLASARITGIDPIEDLRSCWNLKRPVELIATCREYYIDELTHSYPFLVPEAAALLRDIGQRFNDTLAARGGGDYRIKVTSVLRTGESVRRLRRRNVNSVDSSTHRFATTFDISYSKFICDSANTIPRTQEDLKNLLGEILLELRDQQRCWVKFEKRQACYHITVRQPDTLTTDNNTNTNNNDIVS